MRTRSARRASRLGSPWRSRNAFGDTGRSRSGRCLLLLGYVIVAAATIALGFLLIDVLIPVHAIGHNDEAVNTWLASHRDATRSDASFVGSSIGDIPVLPVLVTLVVIVVAALLRRWRVAGFLLGAILIEVATYRIASLIVHRVRPTVPRLDHLPVNQSFPSGHVAASVAVYVSLALLVTSRFPQRWVHVVAWALAVLLPADGRDLAHVSRHAPPHRRAVRRPRGRSPPSPSRWSRHAPRSGTARLRADDRSAA